MTTQRIRDSFTGNCLVAFASCGCWTAVQLEAQDLTERARDTAEFMRDAARAGHSRVETMSHAEWAELGNGVHGNLSHGCDHEPRWGGDQATHAECPRCYKQVKKKRDGTLAQHKQWGRFVCPQEPHERAVAS